MNDATRWRDAMRALGLEWRVGMVDDDGAVCVPWSDGLGFVDCVNGDEPTNYVGGTEDIAVGGGGTEYLLPNPHHPSNLGHLLAMVEEVCGVDDVHVVPFYTMDAEQDVHHWVAMCEAGDHPYRRLGHGASRALALLDALDRKAREVADG